MENKREREKRNGERKDALRRSCGISRRNRIRNEGIKRETTISETVEEETQRTQLFFWYEHVRRMEENRLPRMTMQYKTTCIEKNRGIQRTWFCVIH